MCHIFESAYVWWRTCAAWCQDNWSALCQFYYEFCRGLIPSRISIPYRKVAKKKPAKKVPAAVKKVQKKRGEFLVAKKEPAKKVPTAVNKVQKKGGEFLVAKKEPAKKVPTVKKVQRKRVAMLQEELKTDSTQELPLEQAGPTADKHKPKKLKKKHRSNDKDSECPTDTSTGSRVCKVAKRKAAKKVLTAVKKVQKKRVHKKLGRVTANLKTKMKIQYGSDDESSSSYSSDYHSTDCSTCSSCSCSACCSTSSSSPEPRRQQKSASQRKSHHNSKSKY